MHPESDRRSRHLVELLVRKRIYCPRFPTFRTETESQHANAPSLLRRHLPAEDSAEALFFWHGELAVKTDYGLFLEHWDDFCYPSDDSNVLLLPDLSQAVMYRGDRWYVFNRVDSQPLFPLCRHSQEEGNNHD